MSVLFYITRFIRADPENPDSNRCILSKRQSFVDAAIRQLRQELGAVCGIVYPGKYFDKASYQVYCLMEDSESLEESFWEALAFSSHCSLDSLVAILHANCLCHGSAFALTTAQTSVKSTPKPLDGISTW
uniref:Transketolase like 2 n=1 Tax=Rousettus aegyptiacus TaxID=9407 RepID=A0A7J8JP16_ROUAE|nr:transketolase like 2 [Rousettus aegyptiacus]